MRRGRGLIAGLMAGAASTGVQAQGTVPAPAAQAPAPAASSAQAGPPAQAAPAPSAAQGEPVKEAPPPKRVFRGADGKPLPDDIVRQLEEQFKNEPPPSAEAPVAASGDGAGKDIVVTGQRPRGSVIGDIPPERTLSPLDIRAYGASNIGELLQLLGPQVTSNRGGGDNGPVVFLNGQRVSSFGEIAKIPPEASERLEVCREERAMKYG